MKVIITGATGMLGEAVLHQCLQNNLVSEVLVVTRKKCGVEHIKLKEIIHSDFLNFLSIEPQLKDYDACFFCLGVSSIGKNEAAYTQLTYTLTMHIATTLARLNNTMIFCYISGTSTDSTEKGKLMWARVKGKTENDLMKLSFKRVYNFRPAFVSPLKGAKNTLAIYKYIGWLIPIVKIIAPNYINKASELADAMINTVTKGYEKQVLEVKDIAILAKR